jgi:hypothetical protein
MLRPPLSAAADHDGSLLTLLHRSRIFFDDLPAIHRRRESGSHNDILTEQTRGIISPKLAR